MFCKRSLTKQSKRLRRSGRLPYRLELGLGFGQVKRGADGGRAVGKVVALSTSDLGSLRKNSRDPYSSMRSGFGDHQVPCVEVLCSTVHELHQREEDHTARLA